MNIATHMDILRVVESALLIDLPDIEYEQYTPGNKIAGTRGAIIKRRPMEREVDVYSFPQSWGSTALGFGGMGGCAVTKAQTTVVMSESGRVACVYFGTRLAYQILGPNETFWVDLKRQSMAPVKLYACYIDPE